MFKFFRCIKSDVKCIPNGIKLIVLIIFLRMFGWGFVDPFYSMFINTFSKSYTSVGILLSIMTVTSLLTVIPLIRLADKVKDASLMKDGEIIYFFAIIFYMLAGFRQNIFFLIIALFLNGIAHPLLFVGAEAYVRKHSLKKAGSRAFGYYTAIAYFGWIMGMFIAAFTVHYYSFNTMFLFILPSILLSFFIFPKVHERGLKSIFRGFRKYFHRKQDFVNIFSDMKEVNPKMIFFLVLAFFDGIIVIFSYIFIPLFALSINLHLSEIAFLMAVMYLPFIFSFFFSEAADRLKKMSIIAVGLFITCASFFFLSFIVGELWILVLAAITSFSLAIIRPAYNGMITRLTPRRMLGEITGVNTFVTRLGSIIGPIFTGVIADSLGIHVAFLIIALIAFGLGIATIIFRGFDYLKA